MDQGNSRRKRVLLCFGLCFALCTGCKEGGQSAPKDAGVATKVVVAAKDPGKEAIQQVKDAQTSQKMRVEDFVARYVEKTNAMLKSKNQPQISRPHWSGSCVEGRCQVSLQLKIGKSTLAAWWLVEKKSVKPQNNLAKSFMQRFFKTKAQQRQEQLAKEKAAMEAKAALEAKIKAEEDKKRKRRRRRRRR